MKLRILAAVAATVLSAGAIADPTNSCANTLPITSETGTNPVAAGDLCTFPNSLATYGGISSPQRDAIFSFVAQGAAGTITLAPNAFNANMVLMPTPCNNTTDVIAFGDAANPMAVSGLTNGQEYFVIITADPGGPADACGTFSAAVTGTLPVELEAFEVE